MFHPLVIWDYSLGVCSPSVVGSLLYVIVCGWPHMVWACVLCSDTFPHHPSLVLSK